MILLNENLIWDSENENVILKNKRFEIWIFDLRN